MKQFKAGDEVRISGRLTGTILREESSTSQVKGKMWRVKYKIGPVSYELPFHEDHLEKKKK
jgi:hypothetical protein